MLKYCLFLFTFISVACTHSSSDKHKSISLSVDKQTLDFKSEGGTDSFTVTASEKLFIAPGDSWIRTRNDEASVEYKTTVIVTVDKNPSTSIRKTKIYVVAGDEKKYIEVSQDAKQANNDNGNADDADTSSKLVALSFDDGPNDLTTPAVLDILEEFNVPGSFFVIGNNINDSTAKQMKRAISSGGEIQNHSFTHSHMSKMDIADIIDEITRTDELIEKYTGTRPTLFRPPYIDINDSMFNAVEHTFISGVGCQDWDANHSATDRFNELMGKVQDGDIILLHDFYGNDETVKALRMIIPELKKLGYEFVTVSKLFELKGIEPESHSGFLYTNVLQEEIVQYR